MHQCTDSSKEAFATWSVHDLGLLELLLHLLHGWGAFTGRVIESSCEQTEKEREGLMNSIP
jgi:hypothetical protein